MGPAAVDQQLVPMCPELREAVPVLGLGEREVGLGVRCLVKLAEGLERAERVAVADVWPLRPVDPFAVKDDARQANRLVCSAPHSPELLRHRGELGLGHTLDLQVRAARARVDSLDLCVDSLDRW